MGAPQIIAIILFTFVFTANMALHGKPREGNHSIWTGVIHIAIWLPILIWGGFFNA